MVKIYYTDKQVISALGARIKFLREEKNYSQSHLAAMANIPKQQIGRIERGEINPTISSIARIAEGLEVKIKDLFL